MDMRFIITWDGDPILAAGELRDAEWALRNYGEESIRDKKTGRLIVDDCVQDIVTDVGEVELELREYNEDFSDFRIVRSRYLRPRPEDDDGTDIVAQALKS